MSRHIVRCFPDAFKIRKKTLPSMVESAAECSLTLQGEAELGHDEVRSGVLCWFRESIRRNLRRR